MKKFIPYMLMFIGVLAFLSTVVISIVSEDLPETIISVGLIVIGYFGIILFYIGITLLKKRQTKNN